MTDRTRKQVWREMMRHFEDAACTFQSLPETTRRAYYISYALSAWELVTRNPFTAKELHEIIDELFRNDDEESISATGSGETAGLKP